MVKEFSVRKTNISVRCPHCGELHYLAIALVGKDEKIHRGGSQKEILKSHH